MIYMSLESDGKMWDLRSESVRQSSKSGKGAEHTGKL